MHRKSWSAVPLACLALALGSFGTAQAAYPERTVHIVVGYAAGGGTDALARMVADRLAVKWKQPVVVENRVGATGTIAESVVAHARPDGYYMVLTSNAHVVVPSLMKLDYDPLKALAPISLIVNAPDLLIVNPSYLPVKTTKEFIALARQKPGALNFGGSGAGSSNALSMQVFNAKLGLDMVQIDYGGSAAIVSALLGGEIQAMFGSLSTVGGQITAGKLRALAVSGTFRLPSLPEVPTVAESADLPGHDESVWFGMLTTAGTPPDIIAKLHADIIEALKTPEVQKGLDTRGYYLIGNSPEEFEARRRHEMTEMAEVMTKLGLKK